MSRSIYKVVADSDCDEFVQQVQALLDEGFELAGGLAVDNDPDVGTYLWQALLKPCKEDTNQQCDC